MPVLSRDLELAVRRSLAEAARRGHAQAGLEHLLLALTESDEGAALLDACAVDRARLRADLERHLDASPGAPGGGGEPAPAEGFSRVMQRAAIHVQSAGRELVRCENVIVSMFSERDSPAVALLQAQGMARIDAVNFIVHGVRKEVRDGAPPAAVAAAAAPGSAGEAAVPDAGRAFSEVLRRLPRGVVLTFGPGPGGPPTGGLDALGHLAATAHQDAAWALRTAEGVGVLLAGGRDGEPSEGEGAGTALAALLTACGHGDGRGVGHAWPAGPFAAPVLRFRHARLAPDGALRLAVRVEADPPVAAALAALWVLRGRPTEAAREEIEPGLLRALGDDPGRPNPSVRAFVARRLRDVRYDGRTGVALSPPRPTSAPPS